jgi:hypothetical protein
MNIACGHPHTKYPLKNHHHPDACCEAVECDPFYVISYVEVYGAILVAIILTFISVLLILKEALR